MSWNEATITINGVECSIGESMTLRVAMEALASDMAEDGLGDDEMGKSLAEGYLRNVRSLREKMNY